MSHIGGSDVSCDAAILSLSEVNREQKPQSAGIYSYNPLPRFRVNNAKARYPEARLLFKGNDFAQTDIMVVASPRMTQGPAAGIGWLDELPPPSMRRTIRAS